LKFQLVVNSLWIQGYVLSWIRVSVDL